MNEIYKIKKEDKGKTIVVRPLLNAKNLKKNILSYKVGFSTFNYNWTYRYICFALIDDELKIFDFSKEILDVMNSRSLNSEMLFMNSDKAIKIKIKTEELNGVYYLNNKYNIISDDKYRFDNTPEKREYIKNLLTNTELDLEESLKEIKSSIEHIEIKLPTFKPVEIGYEVKTLKEIYDNELNNGIQ